MEANSRRNFLKKMLIGATSTPLISSACFQGEKNPQNRIQKGEMYYRRLGRTDLMISEISLGGSPVPPRAILHQAVERGVNYVDTSHTYQNGNSERQIGELLKEKGQDKLYVGTKFHLRGSWDASSIIETVEGSLRRLQVDTIDVLLIHGVDNPEILTDEEVLKAFDKLKKQGKCRFQGLSCHSNHHNVVKEAVRSGHYDMINLGYNVFDIDETKKDYKVYDDYLGQCGLRKLINLAHSKDVGIIAMKTLKVGGKRQNMDKYKTGTTSIYQAMLKWALENPNISSVVTEMMNFDQLEEDLAVSGEMLSARERRMLFRYVAENRKDYCHLCGECENNCPSGIATTTILRSLAYYEEYKKFGRARNLYSNLRPSQTPAFCQDCGSCEKACPYGVPVRQRLQEAHHLLA
ncbi:aldo/keto reductase [bacterium]|nr:aldo/keto reductase [bacterium]